VTRSAGFRVAERNRAAIPPVVTGLEVQAGFGAPQPSARERRPASVNRTFSERAVTTAGERRALYVRCALRSTCEGVARDKRGQDLTGTVGAGHNHGTAEDPTGDPPCPYSGG
jgi:hypothetical protein